MSSICSGKINGKNQHFPFIDFGALQSSSHSFSYFLYFWDSSWSILSTLGTPLEHQGPGILPRGSWYCSPGQMSMCSQATTASLRRGCAQWTTDSNRFWLLLFHSASLLSANWLCMFLCKAGGHPGCCISLFLAFCWVLMTWLGCPFFCVTTLLYTTLSGIVIFFSFLRSRSIISALLSLRFL